MKNILVYSVELKHINNEFSCKTEKKQVKKCTTLVTKPKLLWLMLWSCYVRVSEWTILYSLPEYQGTPCSKQAPYLKFKWQQRDSYPQFGNWPVWLNDWVFVYELNGSGFESRCCHQITVKYKIVINIFEI